MRNHLCSPMCACSGRLGRAEVSLFFSPAGVLVVAPLPDGTFRIVATLNDAPEKAGIKDIQALIDTRGPTTGHNRVEEVVWGSRFRIHHRVAKSYRKGRFLLMGDAAHVHSPAGGQGMNTGLVDAVVLGRLLADVVNGKRPEFALGSYEELRRPAATKVSGPGWTSHEHGNDAGSPEAFAPQCRTVADKYSATGKMAPADESFRARPQESGRSAAVMDIAKPRRA